MFKRALNTSLHKHDVFDVLKKKMGIINRNLENKLKKSKERKEKTLITFLLLYCAI